MSAKFSKIRALAVIVSRHNTEFSTDKELSRDKLRFTWTSEVSDTYFSIAINHVAISPKGFMIAIFTM